MPGPRRRAAPGPQPSKGPAAKGKQPVSRKRKADTQPEPIVQQPVSRPKGGKAARVPATAAPPPVANGAHLVGTATRASKRARVETSAAAEVAEAAAAKRKPPPAAASAKGRVKTAAKANGKGKASAAGKASVSAASRKQAIRAEAKAASRQQPDATVSASEQLQPDPVSQCKAKAGSKRKPAAASSDADQVQPEERVAAAAEPDPASVAVTAAPTQLSRGKRKGKKAGKAKAAKAEAHPADVSALVVPAEKSLEAAASSEQAAVVSTAEVPAQPSSQERLLQVAAVTDEAAAHGEEALHTKAAGTAAHPDHANGDADVAMLANGHAPVSVSGPRANGMRESIIRTRTGQALEKELADARARLCLPA